MRIDKKNHRRILSQLRKEVRADFLKLSSDLDPKKVRVSVFDYWFDTESFDGLLVGAMFLIEWTGPNIYDAFGNLKSWGNRGYCYRVSEIDLPENSKLIRRASK